MSSQMDVHTTRFGTLSVPEQDELLFPQGLIGLEDCRRWVVLTDSDNPALGWLQSIEHGHIALGVVSPRRFVSDYQLRVDRDELRFLELATEHDAEVVVIASRQESDLTLNLRAPLVINVQQRRGCQVVAKDAYPVRFALTAQTIPLRRTA
ncbi:MAG: flagellar assembly protein FliW [Planctomycetes bacterium]|nr:flagellar assembly protein FliW [Planctomycetota bacterium]